MRMWCLCEGDLWGTGVHLGLSLGMEGALLRCTLRRIFLDGDLSCLGIEMRLFLGLG